MPHGKLDVFICLLHCKIESCDKLNWMYLFVYYIVGKIESCHNVICLLLNVFICLLHCKIESCHKVNWMYLFVYYIVI